MAKFNSLDQLGALRNDFPEEEQGEGFPEDSLGSADEKETFINENNDEVDNNINHVNDDVNDDDKEIKNNKPETSKNPKDIYLLGGRDAEMWAIKKKLDKIKQPYFNRELKWGAKIQDYSEQISKILETGDTPVAIELAEAETIKGVVNIDHHYEKSDRPASLLQVMDRLGLKPSLFDELIAANDSGYIPAMEEKIEKYRSQIEPRAGKDFFEELKNKWINTIRKIDRREQGITAEQEKQAEEAIKNREDLYNKTLSIVRLPHNQCATVTDRLYGTYENLFIPSANGESNFYGNGKLCQELEKKYEGSLAGGAGLGSKSGKAYWSGYPDQEELEKYIKDKTKDISENFARFDSLFTPDNFSDLTELGKKLYELGSFERMNEAVEVSKVEVVDGGKDFIIKMKAKEGWKMYETRKKHLLGGDYYMGQRREAQKTFGLENENSPVPSYLFLQNEEKISELIGRGLQETEDASFAKGPYINGKYYEVIKKFPIVEKAVKNKLDTIDPRLLKYSFGVVDVSPQNSWDDLGRDLDGDSYLKNPCNDFKLLGVSEYHYLNLKEGKEEIFTSSIQSSAAEIKKQYEELEETLNQFESAVNREIQEKRIDYLKRVYLYVQKQEEELEQIKNDPEFANQYFAQANIENPLEFHGTYEDFEKLNTFLKDKIVATYQTYDSGNDYSEYIEGIGQYSGLELSREGGTFYGGFYGSGLNKAIKTIDSSVSFPADTFSVDKIIEAIEQAGFEVEGRGRSGFRSRNSFVVLLPKVKVNAHVIKYGEAINKEKVGPGKVWYCGEVTVEISDKNKKEEVQKIIEGVRQEETNRQIQNFIDEFKSKGDGVTALMRTGGTEKYQYIPDRFKVLASIRIANTQDHRQNLSHTYENLLLDTEAIKGRKSITIKIPDNIKGLVIGKGGSNIKRISEELGLFIKIV